MKVGLDTYTLSGLRLSAFEMLDFAQEHGLDGLQFGSGATVSPTLDHGELREFQQEADRRGLYVELSVPIVNPYRLATNEEVLKAGDGGVRRGMERFIRAAQVAGGRELHSAIGLLADRLPGPGQWVQHNDGQGTMVREQFGRFRLDPSITWGQQIAATVEFLRELGPLLRDLDCRINLETHADATTFELVRIVEELGDDVQGITLDIANTMNQLEDPVAAARRAAPYVHLTHTKDGLIFFNDGGLVWQPRPCGTGSVDFEAILPILGEHAPDLSLSIEDHKFIYELPIFNPSFLAAHPELTPVELAELVRLARLGQGRIDRGETADPVAYELVPWAEHQVARLEAARDYLKGLLARLGLESAATHV